MPFFKRHPKKIGLALGSGSARGLAHIGVIKALDEMGIYVDYVAGTSIGALVGAVYASGNIETLEDVVLKLDWKKIINLFDIVFPRSGLLDGKKITDFIRQHVKGQNIEDLALPFCAVATDLTTGKEVSLAQGDVIEAIRASISIPGILTPVKKGNMVLVDGGLVNPVPVSEARKMGAEFVIAVDLNHDILDKKAVGKSTAVETPNRAAPQAANQNDEGKKSLVRIWNKKLAALDFSVLSQVMPRMDKEDSLPGIFDILVNSINIMEMQITDRNLRTDTPDLLIRPKLGHINFLEFKRAQITIEEGYRATKAQF
ncbi:MAG: patatin-like phospholipase family protein, partial [bacterium]